MAKAIIDPKVNALITLKSMISNLRNHSLVIAFDEADLIYPGIIYMAPTTSGESEGFIFLTDAQLVDAAKIFSKYFIDIPQAVSFNKALKKTKTIVTKKSDNSLIFSTDGYEDTLTLRPISDLKDFTKLYKVLFHDKDITKSCLNAVYGNSIEWITVSDEELSKLRHNELVILQSMTDDPIFVSKSIFGGLKKTKSLSHTVLSTDMDSELVLFRQEEDGYCVYKLIRFLTNL